MAPAKPSLGYPTNGDPATNTDPTVPGEFWVHMVTEGLVTVIEAASLVPDDNPTQFRDALLALAAASGQPGAIQAYAGAAAPTGWLECDGSAVSRSTYAGLYSAIGVTWGAGDGVSTFNLPDLRRRALVGAGGAGTPTLGFGVGDTGGAETHALSVSEMPSHSHGAGTLTASLAGEHTHDVPTDHRNAGLPGGAQRYNLPLSYSESGGHQAVDPAGTHSHAVTGSTGSRGNGEAHNNLQPSAAVVWAIRV